MMLTSTATGRTGLSDTAPPFIKVSGDLPAPAGLAFAVSLAAASGHRDRARETAIPAMVITTAAVAGTATVNFLSAIRR